MSVCGLAVGFVSPKKAQYLCVIVFIEWECVESDFGWEPPVGVSLDSSVLCQRQDGAQTHLFN